MPRRMHHPDKSRQRETQIQCTTVNGTIFHGSYVIPCQLESMCHENVSKSSPTFVYSLANPILIDFNATYLGFSTFFGICSSSMFTAINMSINLCTCPGVTLEPFCHHIACFIRLFSFEEILLISAITEINLW